MSNYSSIVPLTSHGKGPRNTSRFSEANPTQTHELLPAEHREVKGERSNSQGEGLVNKFLQIYNWKSPSRGDTHVGQDVTEQMSHVLQVPGNVCERR